MTGNATFRPLQAIQAMYMRGGTSKGVFFRAEDLPDDPAARDALLLRVMGSPDPYGKQIDGLGGATSSTSKVIIVAPCDRPDADVQYWFGQVAIDRSLIDWSGNCGNLTAAVGPFALHAGLVSFERAADESAPAGMTRQRVRLWQAGIGKLIEAQVPVCDGQVIETGDFMLDGVAFPSARIDLAFRDPAGPPPIVSDQAHREDQDSAADALGTQMGLFPTGRPQDVLVLPDGRQIRATLINAGNPAIFVEADWLGLTGLESQDDINQNADLLAACETVRACGAVAMGLATTLSEATAKRPSTPKLAFFARPGRYTASDGRQVEAEVIDLAARIFSMGKLHHAMTGTGAVAIAAAAAVPGTIVSDLLGQPAAAIRFGHPSGVLEVGAQALTIGTAWHVAAVTMSRSARRLMAGTVFA